MQTYSHFLWTLALYRWYTSTGIQTQRYFDWLPCPVSLSAVLLGSVLPDLPLITITIYCMISDFIRQTQWTEQLFASWYFEDPFVKAAHNWFHSPVTLTAMLLLLSACCRGSTTESSETTTTTCCSSAWWTWVLLACCFHTLCDIPVHHDDGPLLLFPFNWHYRFRSPLSYWDPHYHGRFVAVLEHCVDGCVLVWEATRCARRTTAVPYQAVDDGSSISGVDNASIPLDDPAIDVEMETRDTA